eukprot:1160526-Pelagomonas_calceolata.AAC.13
MRLNPGTRMTESWQSALSSCQYERAKLARFAICGTATWGEGAEGRHLFTTPPVTPSRRKPFHVHKGFWHLRDLNTA